jgi:hypothetical protein
MKNETPIWKVIGLTLLFCALEFSNALGVTYTSFDISGSAYIQPQAINPSGVVTGWWQDASFSIHHGFVRALDGAITAIDLGSDTQPQAINPMGIITGFYTDQSHLGIHGFVQAPNGSKPTTLDFGNDSNTQANGINPPGIIVGTYNTSGNNFSGFILRRGGHFTPFDVPSTNSAVTVTWATSINPAGAITGYYIDQSGQHGFLRTPGGSFATFDPQFSPSVTTQATQPLAINPAGIIVGYYFDINGSTHGFIRATNDTLTTIDGLNLPPPPPAGFPTTHVFAINPGGTIVGDYTDASGTLHGFFLPPGGTFTPIDFPGSTVGGTAARAINPAGVITGYYFTIDPITFVITYHGFLRTP